MEIEISGNVQAECVAGRSASYGVRVEVHRLDRAQLGRVERLVDGADQLVPRPGAVERRGQREQPGLRRLGVGAVVVEGDARRLLRVRDDLGPLVDQQPAHRLRRVEGARRAAAV